MIQVSICWFSIICFLQAKIGLLITRNNQIRQNRIVEIFYIIFEKSDCCESQNIYQAINQFQSYKFQQITQQIRLSYTMQNKLKVKDKKSSEIGTVKSLYSKLYSQYMKSQFRDVEKLLKNIERQTNAQIYYLKYPLFTLLKAISKKLLLNFYECIVFGYLISLTKWNIDSAIIEQYKYHVPDVIFLNDPTDHSEWKKLTLFLYLNCYTVKEFLCDQISIYLRQMKKVIKNFDEIYDKWMNTQQTTDQKLDPRVLNMFYNKISKDRTYHYDYNDLVDKILMISPCYDIDHKVSSSIQTNIKYVEQRQFIFPVYQQQYFVNPQRQSQEKLESYENWPQQNKYQDDENFL